MRARRGPAPTAGPNATTITITTHGDHQDRTAEDAVEQISEAVRWLDSADLVVLDALGDGEFTLTEACEAVLVMHGRIRRALGAAVVRAA